MSMPGDQMTTTTTVLAWADRDGWDAPGQGETSGAEQYVNCVMRNRVGVLAKN
ncbi:NADP oxidoreductase [Anopheles sinensis]|uniref:NADP oxidoreductase n=1 Tax=Anopheles sinensis TaxID=74873 RepID=A0A084VLS8_ANOSI|nr:NADP oxidoreductase [Anopheles sinensis]